MAKEKLSATDEKARLDAFYADECAKLAAAVEEERRAEVERKAAEAEKARDALRDEAKTHAEYLIDLSEKATKLTDELFRVLIERRESLDDFARKYHAVAGSSLRNHAHRSHLYASALGDILKLAHMQQRGADARFLDIDIRVLHGFLDAKTIAKATA
ncbi:hypothetical protein [Neoaquamicrobium sediminum]|uniref:Uncharacterized protein n=1 Tax=Neoaquamicrobium sediminum TaxID=1849104 RepID=A0ABV3WUC7_9HYPH